MKLLQGLLITSMALSLAGCCGGKKEDASRWDANNKDKPPSATATTKPTTTPASTTATAKPTAPATTTTATPAAGKDCKKFATGTVNKAFPDEADGFKRVYKADKEGYAEAEYTKDKTTITATITSAPEKKGEYASVTDKVSGFPYKTFGKNKSNLFVNDCYLISIASQTLDEGARKPWLGKFKFSSLP